MKMFSLGNCYLFAAIVLGLGIPGVLLAGEPPRADRADAVECMPRAGLPNFFAKLKAGAEVRIAYLGGSITAQEGWRPKTLRWFQERYPKARISEVNAAIGGTGSDLGVFRLRQDVLERRPDLLFVEFAVNDGGAPPEAIHRSMEGIVRKTWRADPAADICFVYTLAGGMLQELKAGKYPRAASAMEAIAGHYGIPSIHLGVEVARLEKEGKLVFQGKEPRTDEEKAALAGKILFSSDAVHPYPETGHRVYLEAVARSMERIEPLGQPGPHALQDPFAADNREKAEMVPLSRAKLSAGWRKLDPEEDGVARAFRSRLPDLWKAEKAGESLEFRFRGTAAGIYDLLGPDCGQVLISVDGKPGVAAPRFDSYCTYHRLGKFMAGEGLPDAVHTVRIEVHPGDLDKAAILAKLGNRIDDPRRFEGRSWYAGCLLAIGELLESGGERPGRPNFLFLLSDDQRADTISAHGNPHIRTPHLDRLAAEGFSFRGNYCFGGNSGAVCVPSRAMIHSGRVWLRVPNDLAGVKILPELFRENGYETFATGKWHNQEPSFLRGFERGKAVFFGGMSDHTKVPLKDIVAGGKLGNERAGGKFSSEIFADAAVEFLEGYRGDRPFFAYVAFTAPHDPRMPPEAYRQHYYDHPPPLPENFLPQHPFDNGHMKGGRDEDLAPWPRTPEVLRDQLAEYYGMIEHLDGQIGRILEALRRTGRDRDTVVVFAADQGLALGSHGLLGKQSLYEHSMRAPLIIGGPGIPRGKSTSALTYLLDLYPTICGLAGIEPPQGLDGKSLAPLWDGSAARIRDSVFLAFLEVQRAVRDDRWKLIAYPKIGHLQLFDLEEDPLEMRNLIDDPQRAGKAQELLALLRRWQAETGDRVQVPDRSTPPEKVDLTGRSRKPDQWQPEWIRKKYFGAEGK